MVELKWDSDRACKPLLFLHHGLNRFCQTTQLGQHDALIQELPVQCSFCSGSQLFARNSRRSEKETGEEREDRVLVFKENKGFQPAGGDSIFRQLTFLLAQLAIELQLGKLNPEHHPPLDAGGKDFGTLKTAQPFKQLCNRQLVLCS